MQMTKKIEHTKIGINVSYLETRIHVPVPVPISETPEPGAMTETSPEFRMAPVIRKLTLRVNYVT